MLFLFLCFALGYKGVHYGIMVDAGSAGTRAHIFTWNNIEGHPSVQPYPTWHKGIVIKSHIPLSKAASDKSAISDIFNPIITKASQKIPASFLSDTKMYIYATAGLRILPKATQEEIIKNTYNYLLDNSPFKILKKNVRIMSGAEEAIYGWITVQHLLNVEYFGESKLTSGSIDMGGASIQVAYETRSRRNIHRVFIKDIYTKSYSIYAVSMLGLGVNEAMKKIYIVNDNPCFPKGYISEDEQIRGLGSFEKCQSLILQTFSDQIRKGHENPRYDSLIINDFYGMASFFYTNQFFQLKDDSSLTELINSTENFCNSNWGYLIEKHKNNHFLKNYCFFGTFQSVFLSNGFGFNFSRSRIVKSGSLNGAELSWAMGAMMKEIKAAKIDPFYFPSYWPIVFINTYMLFCFAFKFFQHKKKAKKGFLSTQMDKML